MKYAVLLLALMSCERAPRGLSHSPTHADTVLADSMIAAQAAARQRSMDSASVAQAREDSTPFTRLVDSMSADEGLVTDLGDDSAAAPVLFHLGKLKARAVGWMILGNARLSIGAGYAKAHPREFGYFDPDGQFYYNGLHWRLLLTRFPQSSLADSARWYLAHLQRGHGD
ncbi:MAG TPA: hypothetical protein VJS20_12260 [Gemmatimonadales bacterium]|nr:hypothetical protein [Gemmatimonadales bacterium]